MPFPEARELAEAIAEAARLADEMTKDGSTAPGPSTLAAIRDAGAWDLFVCAGRGARRAANPHLAPTEDVAIFGSGAAASEEAGDAGAGGVAFSRGDQELVGGVKITLVGAAEKVGDADVGRFAGERVGTNKEPGSTERIIRVDADNTFARLRREFPGLPPVSAVADFADLPAAL